MYVWQGPKFNQGYIEVRIFFVKQGWIYLFLQVRLRTHKKGRAKLKAKFDQKLTRNSFLLSVT